MSIAPLIDSLAREHPAFVHVPLGLVAALPLAMLASFRLRHGRLMAGTSLFLGGVAWLASTAALFSGWMWGRQINLIGPSAFLPVVASEKQALQKILQIHILMASAGFLVGGACVFLLWRSWRRGTGSGGGHFWQRGVGAPALVAGLLWLGCWAFCGKLGGIMVFGNEETNRAAAEADAARRNDSEADLPIRALDYASLEPAESSPSRSQAHGGRWGRIWVTASGIDAYKEGKPLPPGAYAVISTFSDDKGRPGSEPGPLYMREARADGSPAFAFYWARVPEAFRKEFGDDSVYWRSPDPRLAACLGCHGKGGAPAK